eukprot:6194720-Amphidinium_carterae.1
MATAPMFKLVPLCSTTLADESVLLGSIEWPAKIIYWHLLLSPSCENRNNAHCHLRQAVYCMRSTSVVHKSIS